MLANLKPTPLKVHYSFNHRELFKFVTAFCKVEGNYLKTEANLVKLFYHEAVRQYADKILMRHDLDWFQDTLRKLIWDTFDLMPNKELEVKTTTNQDGEPVALASNAGDEEVKLPDGSEHGAATAHDKSQYTSQPTIIGGKDPNAGHNKTAISSHIGTELNDPNRRIWPIEDEHNLWFSVMNMDVDGYYCEFRAPPDSKDRDVPIYELINKKIQFYLDKYNEQPDKARISLTLYREFNRHLFKIIRALNMHDGHVLIVGMKGYGIGMLIRLACFASNIQFNKMELHPNFIDEEWRTEMRKNIIYSASEDKPLAYCCDEYRITNDHWYRDLETLVKSNVCSEITRQHDVLAALFAIQTQ